MITIVIEGKEYRRDYKENFCDLKGCGKRIQFKMSAKGVPESSDKYNARCGCCTDHSRALNKLRKKTKIKSLSPVDMWLSMKLTSDTQLTEK